MAYSLLFFEPFCLTLIYFKILTFLACVTLFYCNLSRITSDLSQGQVQLCDVYLWSHALLSRSRTVTFTLCDFGEIKKHDLQLLFGYQGQTDWLS